MPALIPLLVLVALVLCIGAAWKSSIPLWPAVFVLFVVLFLLSGRS